MILYQLKTLGDPVTNTPKLAAPPLLIVSDWGWLTILNPPEGSVVVGIAGAQEVTRNLMDFEGNAPTLTVIMNCPGFLFSPNAAKSILLLVAPGMGWNAPTDIGPQDHQTEAGWLVRISV